MMVEIKMWWMKKEDCSIITTCDYIQSFDVEEYLREQEQEKKEFGVILLITKIGNKFKRPTGENIAETPLQNYSFPLDGDYWLIKKENKKYDLLILPYNTIIEEMKDKVLSKNIPTPTKKLLYKELKQYTFENIYDLYTTSIPLRAIKTKSFCYSITVADLDKIWRSHYTLFVESERKLTKAEIRRLAQDFSLQLNIPVFKSYDCQEENLKKYNTDTIYGIRAFKKLEADERLYTLHENKPIPFLEEL